MTSTQKKVVLLAKGDLQAYRLLFFVFFPTLKFTFGKPLDKMEEILWKKNIKVNKRTQN